MVPSLKELNQICQKPQYREAGNWMVRKILRDAALPVTWLLLHIPVTANQVTFFSLIIGVSGTICFAFSGDGWFLLGALLLQFWYFLDHVDGQIARYYGTSSLTGRFYDFLTHHIIHGILFFSLGLHVYQVTGSFITIVWAFVASFAMILFNLFHDIKSKAFVEKILGAKTIQIKNKEQSEKSEASKNNWKSAFSLLHKTCEIHVVMNLLTVAVFLQTIFKAKLDLRLPFFFYYGLAVPFLTITKSFVWIKTKKIDQEFADHFQPSSD